MRVRREGQGEGLPVSAFVIRISFVIGHWSFVIGYQLRTFYPSQRMHILDELQWRGLLADCTDPQALANARAELADAPASRVLFEADPYDAARGAHALAVLTEWDAYRALDYRTMFESMEKPAFLFDGRNILDHKALYAVGFNVFPIGKPALKHF